MDEHPTKQKRFFITNTSKLFIRDVKAALVSFLNLSSPLDEFINLFITVSVWETWPVIVRLMILLLLIGHSQDWLLFTISSLWWINVLTTVILHTNLELTFWTLYSTTWHATRSNEPNVRLLILSNTILAIVPSYRLICLKLLLDLMNAIAVNDKWKVDVLNRHLTEKNSFKEATI